MGCTPLGGSEPSAIHILVGGPCAPGPYWPFPQLSVGDLHGIFLRRLIAFVSARRSEEGNLRTAIAELTGSGLLGREEIGHLNKLVEIVEHGEDDRRVFDSLRGLQAEMFSVRSCPPPLVALAIVSIGIDSLGGELAEERKGWFKEDLGGAATGAGLGAILGGIGGAVIGAVVGGVGCSLEAALTKSDQRRPNR